MKRSHLAILTVVVLAVLVGGFLTIKRSSLAAPLPGQQGTTFWGLTDVHLWLSGNLVTKPVDWSFTDKFPTVQIQTRPWYVFPYSVTVWTAATHDNNQLYLFSHYFPPEQGKPDLRRRFPEARAWNQHVLRDPRVRLKVGDQLFNLLVYPVTDPREIEAARAVFINKYAMVRDGQEKPADQRPRMYIFKAVPVVDEAAIIDAHDHASSGLEIANAQRQSKQSVGANFPPTARTPGT